MSHDVENLESHPADFETFFSPWKSASKQNKVEKVRDTKGLYMKQLEENENLRRQHDKDVQKINDRIRSVERVTRSIEADQGTIQESVAAAVREEIEQTKLNEGIQRRKEDLEHTRTKPKRQQKNRKYSLVNEPEKVPPGERSQIKVEERVRAIEKTANSNENVQETIHEGVAPAVSEEILQIKIFDDAMELTKQKSDVEEELKTAKSTLKKKTVDRLQIQAKLDAAMPEKNDLEKTFTKTEELYRIIEAKEKEIQLSRMRLNKAQTEVDNAKMQVAILQNRKQELEKSLSREHERSDVLIKLLSKVVTNLKKVEERNTNLEDEVTEQKERLLVEEKTTKEVQTSSLMLNERIKDLEDVRTELESQQKKLKYNLAQEKDRVTRTEGLRVQAENARKTLEQTKAILEKEKEYLTKLLAAEERNETEMKKSLAKATTTCEKLQKAYEILQKEKEDLSEQLSTEKSNSEIQIASFSKMTSHALSGSEMTAQRKDEDSCLGDETQSVITKSTDSGRGSMHSGLEYQESLTLNGRQLNTEFKVAVTVASKGANMHIPDTGVELDIPTGAAQGKVLIEMIILPFDQLDAPVSTFSCNSSVAVELLPNKMQFQRPVRLILPHCLKLTKNYQQTKNQVQVYVSHHETGPPIWEEVSNAKYVLNETNCLIFLKSFCWVKYEVNNKIVEAKRIRVYTAGKRLKHTEDTLAETEVGYHWDLPIARENLSVNDNMFVYQSKPFIFVKQGNLPLEILLTKTVPMQWKYITPEENPKVISFKCVAVSTEKSCPFVIQKSEPTDRMPFCMFKVQQGNEDLELYIRFDD